MERKGRARIFLLVFTFLALSLFFFNSQKIESSDKSEPVNKQDECALGNFEVKVTSCFGFNIAENLLLHSQLTFSLPCF